MLETYIRPTYQKVCIEPLLGVCPAKLKPIHVTLLSGIFGVLAAVLIVLQYPLSAVIALLFSGYLDTFDGSLARSRQISSEVGSMADILTDRVVEFSVVFGLYLVAPEVRGISSFAMLGAVLLCVTAFLVVGIFVASSGEKSFHYNPGLMERAEAFVFFIAMIIFPSYFNFIAWAFTFLVLLTVVLHIVSFLKSK